MGVDYVVIGFDMEVQQLVTTMQPDLSTWALFACRGQSFAIRAYATLYTLLAWMSWAVIRNTAESRTASQDSRMHCKVQTNEWHLILWRFSSKEWDETRPSHLCLKSTNEDFSVGFWYEVICLISINYNLSLSVDPAFCESYTCMSILF